MFPYNNNSRKHPQICKPSDTKEINDRQLLALSKEWLSAKMWHGWEAGGISISYSCKQDTTILGALYPGLIYSSPGTLPGKQSQLNLGHLRTEDQKQGLRAAWRAWHSGHGAGSEGLSTALCSHPFPMLRSCDWTREGVHLKLAG